jgi:hypothetical protein
VQGYAAHYCSLSSQVDPTVVACSFIASGLRVFDISDLLHPKEIAYYVAPPQPRSENDYTASEFAMSQPAFAPERHEIWFTDGTSGFYVVRVADSVWPASGGGVCSAATHSRHTRIHKGVLTSFRASFSAGGKPVSGAAVKLRAPGIVRTAKTDAHGRATFKVRARRSGRVIVSTTACGGRLKLTRSR